VPFGFFDGLFWGAALKKIPQGAWAPLMIGLILVIFMTFWTWAKGLEDKFDGKNRKNLRHFIMQNDDRIQLGGGHLSYGEASTEQDANEPAYGAALYYLSQPNKNSYPDDISEKYLVEEKKELTRIPSCAVFHKLTPGQGVPHSFVGFIRQWPALPNVVIFLSVRVLAIARVNVEERYLVTKVRTIPGFYGVTYCLGFRDGFEVKVDEVINQICTLEHQMDPSGSAQLINQIRASAQTSTHIVPHYHVVSRDLQAGRLNFVFFRIRAWLIEGLYRRIATMFPETANWLGSADEIIRVGVNAVI